jgi:protease I
MPDIVPATTGALAGRKIAVLMESDYVEQEIFYYERRFAEEGADLHFLTRLWGAPQQTFFGHEYRVPYTVDESFEDMTDEELRSYAAVIVPSGMVSDRLRYTDDVNVLAPATAFAGRAIAEPGVLVGITPEVVRGRKVVVHNNLVGDARNMGAEYVDADVVIDGDLITGRSVHQCHLFAHTLVDLLSGGTAS